MVLTKLKEIKVTQLFYYTIITLNVLLYLKIIQRTLLNGQFSFI